MTNKIKKIVIKAYKGGQKSEDVVKAILRDGEVVFEGEQELIKNLQNGLQDRILNDGKTIYPKDGAAFMRLILQDFDLPQLYAEVVE